MPNSLLGGRFLHCRPSKESKIIAAPIFHTDDIPVTNNIIVCPMRLPASKCDSTGTYCHYWRTPYIIGPDMDKKEVNYG